MFILSLFGHSRLLVLGSGLYLISDSLIALHEFVFPANFFVSSLELMAWPLYWSGQACITIGALNVFSDMQLHADPAGEKNSVEAPLFVNVAALVALGVALRRLWQGVH